MQNNKQLKNLTAILKIGTSNKNYPPYASFLHSDGDKLYTRNMAEAVCVDYKAGFKGDVNFFVLNGILNKTEEFEITQEESTMSIKSGHTSYKIVIEDMNFPHESIIKPESDYTLLSTDIIDTLKVAVKYATGIPVYDKIYMDGEHIISFGNNILFLHKIKTGFKEKIGIDKKILSVLTPGCYVSSVNENFVVAFDGGFIIFETDSIEAFNDSLIKKFFDNRRENIEKLCSVEKLKKAIDKISPIFYGEKVQQVNLMNKSNSLTVTGESVLNGISKVTIDSIYKKPISINISATLLNNIDESFDVYINEEYSDCLYLTDGGSEIIIRKEDEC